MDADPSAASQLGLQRPGGRRGGSGVGEILAWFCPPILALLAHFVAFPKAFLGPADPDIGGVGIALYDSQTILAQRMWHFVQGNWWLFLAYVLCLMGVLATMRLAEVRSLARGLAWFVAGLPGLFYFFVVGRLGFKLIL